MLSDKIKIIENCDQNTKRKIKQNDTNKFGTFLDWQLIVNEQKIKIKMSQKHLRNFIFIIFFWLLNNCKSETKFKAKIFAFLNKLEEIKLSFCFNALMQ